MTTDIEQQLRRAFEHRAQHTAVGNDVDQNQNASMHRSGTLVRKWPQYASVAAAAVLVVVGLVAIGAARDDQVSPTKQTPALPLVSTPPTTTVAAAPVDTVPPTTRVAAAQDSPFVGAWVSTDTAGPSQTMFIDQWGTDTYLVRVSDSDQYQVATVCASVGRLTSETSLVVARRARPSNGAEASCDDGVSEPQTELPFTLDVTNSADQIVDSVGVVWRERVAPAPDAGDVTVLEAFLGARVAGEGAENFMPRVLSGEARVPLLYATTSGVAYERFDIERLQDPDGIEAYNIRLVARDGTVVQQRFTVSSVAVYGGLTLEDGHAVPVPFSILDGEVSFEVAPTWEVESLGDTHVALVHRFGGSSIVIATEPLAVGGGACGTIPAPTNAEELARLIFAYSGYEVTEPLPVRIAGVDGFQIDVAVSDPQYNQYLCTFEETGTLTAVQSGGTRIRLLMVDHPGPSADVITVANMTTQDEFDDAIAELAPIVDSVEFHLG